VTVLALWMQSAGAFGGIANLALPVIFFFVAMYFLMILPNQKKQKAWSQMLGAIKSGDRVTTTGGIRGTVLQVKDDTMILRIAPDNVKLEFVKSAISAVTTEDEKTV